jgi:hypothetical protein
VSSITRSIWVSRARGIGAPQRRTHDCDQQKVSLVVAQMISQFGGQITDVAHLSVMHEPGLAYKPPLPAVPLARW